MGSVQALAHVTDCDMQRKQAAGQVIILSIYFLFSCLFICCLTQRPFLGNVLSYFMS